MKKMLPLLLLTSAALFATEVPQMTLRGSATLSKAPDQVTVTLGVTTEAETAAEALAENNKRMQEIVKGLKSLGIGSKELATSQFTITPIFAPPPKQRPANWVSKIESFRVDNLLTARSSDISLAGKMIDVAAKSGANNIQSVNFALKDERAFRKEAIEAAAKNALADAEILAAAAGQKIVRILNLTLDEQDHITPFPKARMQFAAYSESTPLEPGEAAVSAEVTAVFELSAP